MTCKITEAKSWSFVHRLSGLHVVCTVLNFLYNYVFLQMSMFLTTTAGLGKGEKKLQSNSSGEHANSNATGSTISIFFCSIIK